ncbi:MAG TPA: hypothetical protein P5154_03260 [Candidatus Izemoplasmatales bacterium]|nr:hypothetical protein [Bacillota bacterium]HRY77760.1 hypothetical protein [Candidatus Izemoplasmatales bacterium]
MEQNIPRRPVLIRFFRRPEVGILLMLGWNLLLIFLIRAWADPYFGSLGCLDLDVCPGHAPLTLQRARIYYQISVMALFVPTLVGNPLFAMVYGKYVFRSPNVKSMLRPLLWGTGLSVVLILFAAIWGEWNFLISLFAGFVLFLHLGITIHHFNWLG